MNRDSYAAVALAICCIAAVGMSSTTLASTLQQDPDDVVDPDYETLPIGTEQGQSVKEAVQGESGESGGGTKESGGDSGASGDTTDEQGSDTSESSAKQEGGQSSEGGQSGSGGDVGLDEGGRGDGTGDGPGVTLLTRLLGLLEQLLPLLALLAALALAYRYRRYLLALVAAVPGSFQDGTEERSAAEGRWPTERPSNEVHRVWLSMVDRLDVDRPRSRTPSECAAVAIDAGLDPAAVRTLTNVFEEVRYGEKPVTEERRRRARRGLERLDGGGSA